ncbi:MFS transporter [Acidisphaera sp. S103]|uniref:MFS transporter n=1 Tax=Acidisphaera sp. S103 TaxID=1747223 RepID=UPI00131C610F|nr:MFS transporter [Acidisphaera sp. S103]
MSHAIIDRRETGRIALPILSAISFCHLLNDMMQSLLAASYPILKGGFNLSFAQIGFLTLIYQITASLLQPLIGLYTDRKPLPYSLPFGMGASMTGLATLAFAPTFAVLLIGAVMLGLGSSIFHPEASRIARLASGNSRGLAQSVFQVGGNFGSSLAPLIVAFFILPRGRSSLSWLALLALGGVIILTGLGHWCKSNSHARPSDRGMNVKHFNLLGTGAGRAMAILIVLIFSKFVYVASFASFYIFYLMDRFGLPTQTAQIYYFIFVVSGAIGTIIGGPIGDKIGRKSVIWASILGVLPFTLLVPYVGLTATVTLSILIALIMSSAFPAIVVYAQDLMPGRVGMVSGLFFGLAFGIGGISAAGLGVLADHMGIEFVYRVCSFLPLVGLLAGFLPNISDAARKLA